MKINTKSWHYRFLNSLNTNIPNSLCPYFWKVVFTIAWITGSILLLIVGFASIGAGIFEGIGFALDNMVLYWSLAAVVGTVTVTSAIVLVVAVIFGFDWAKENFKPPYKEEPLIITFVKNKKSKICPRLEFEDMSKKTEE